MSICLIGLVAIVHPKLGQADELRPRSGSPYVQITGDDAEDERTRWDTIFNTATYVFGTEPFPFLKENIHLLPVGKALDLASSEGRNSVFLAKRGFQVTGVDYSDVALTKARRLAHANHVSIKTVNADLTDYTIKPESYDVILNIDFPQRGLITQIKRGLRHGGMVVYVGYTEDQTKNEAGKSISHREKFFKKGELKELFKDFKVLVYKETNDGNDAYANLIAKKP
ncbi:MAG: class I SAM-dependent methyltransferase [Bdellovibrionia bacterium]